MPNSHPAYPLVEDLINRLIINFPEDRPYNPHWVVSGKPLDRPLCIWFLVWIMIGSSATLHGLSDNSVYVKLYINAVMQSSRICKGGRGGAR